MRLPWWPQANYILIGRDDYLLVHYLSTHEFPLLLLQLWSRLWSFGKHSICISTFETKTIRMCTDWCITKLIIVSYLAVKDLNPMVKSYDVKIVKCVYIQASGKYFSQWSRLPTVGGSKSWLWCTWFARLFRHQPKLNISHQDSLIARFMWPTWGPHGTDRTQVGSMLTPWILLSGLLSGQWGNHTVAPCTSEVSLNCMVK